MNNIPPQSPSDVPSICIVGADDSSALFNGDSFLADTLSICPFSSVEEAIQYECSQGSQTSCRTSNAFPPLAELEDMPELSHLSITSQEYFTGPGYSLPYAGIIQENGTTTDGGLFPYTIGSPIPSPSSLGSSVSPSSSFYGSLVFTDIDHSPSPATSDLLTLWQPESDPLTGSFPNDPTPPYFVPPQSGPHRSRSRSSPPRHGPVASKAMLEANGRRRRHPAQFECPECGQTFTAQFSLRRHAQSHTGERPFECSIPGCRQRFYNSSDCKRHEKSRKRHKDIAM